MNNRDKEAWLKKHGSTFLTECGVDGVHSTWSPWSDPDPNRYVVNCYAETKEEGCSILYDNIKDALFLLCDRL